MEQEQQLIAQLLKTIEMLNQTIQNQQVVIQNLIQMDLMKNPPKYQDSELSSDLNPDNYEDDLPGIVVPFS